MNIDSEGRQFRLLTVHGLLWSFAMSLANGFVGAYLMRLGYDLATTVVLFAMLLAVRFAMRAFVLPVVRRLGMRRAIVLGTVISAFQFLPLIRAEEPLWLGVWVLVVSVGQCIYWPICHAANAVCGGGGRRGRQIALRQLANTAISVVGPVAGGLFLTRMGPGAEFAIATVVCLVSALPLLWVGQLELGAVPGVRRSLRFGDPIGFFTFAADGWMFAGLGIAWPLILFSMLDSSYMLLGWASGAAAVAGAVAGFWCGVGIDRGHRPLLCRVVTVALLIGVAARVASAWAPDAAFAANIFGSAVGGLYYPVLMSVVYDRAKRSRSAYQFHVSTEAGWDAGAILGCLATAAAAWSGLPLPLAMLPSAIGVFVMHHCVRADAIAVGEQQHDLPEAVQHEAVAA